MLLRMWRICQLYGVPSDGKHGHGKPQTAHEPYLPEVIARPDRHCRGSEHGISVRLVRWMHGMHLFEHEQAKRRQKRCTHHAKLVPSLQIDIVWMGDRKAHPLRPGAWDLVKNGRMT